MSNNNSNNKSNKGLVIGIICGAAALCIILLLLFVFDVFGLRDNDDDDDVAEVTTEVEDEDEDSETSETVIEATTEVENASPEDAEAKAYGEKMGYVFSDPSTVSIKQSGYPRVKDEAGNELNVNYDDFMSDYSYEETIEKIAVTDPDENGNVTYIVKTRVFHEAEFSQNPDGVEKFTWSLHCWLFDISDYYTGTVIGYNSGKKGTVTDKETKTLYVGGKNVDVDFTRFSMADNGDDMTYDDSTGLSYDNYTRHHFYYVTVPQDYDGLVLSVPKTYDHSTNKSHEDDPSIPEDINDETKKLMDIDYYGYTTVDDTVFVRLSDYAVPFTPEVEAEIMGAYEQTSFGTFTWALDALDEKKKPSDVVGEYNSISGLITDPARLEGDWQAMVVWDPDHKLDSYEIECSFANIRTSGSNVSVTFNYKLSYDYGGNETDISDRDSFTCSGDMSESGSITLDSNSMSFFIDYFWSDGISQYGFGKMILPDGTEGVVVLQRP